MPGRETRRPLLACRLAGGLLLLAAFALLAAAFPAAPPDRRADEGHASLAAILPAAERLAARQGEDSRGAARDLGEALDRLAAVPHVAASPMSLALLAEGRALLSGAVPAAELPEALRLLRPFAAAARAELRLLEADAAAEAATARAGRLRLTLGLAGLLALAGLAALLLSRGRAAGAGAARDPLTGLLSREAFAARLAARLAEPSGDRAAILAVGVERLGEINEALGRRAGDALIRGAAKRLSEAVRTSDTVARLSGDTFLILLHGVDDAGLGAAMARLIAAASHPVPHDGAELPLALRMGAALPLPSALPPQEQAESLIREAEAALAASRRDPRGGPSVFTSADREQAERERSLLRALGDPGSSPVGLVAHLQPQQRLADGSLAGFEALLRWPHPALGPLSPGEVLPVAERFGRMPQLGRGVRRSAFGTFAMLRRAGLVPLRQCHIAINISAAELVQPRFVQELASDLVAAGLEPTALELEITEDVLLDDVPERGREALAALRREGVRLALDDFGTGYAGFGQLLRLPLDTLKLDRRFIRGLGTDARAEPIIVSMLGLARGLGFEVVAEGIETEAQRQRLAELGCGIGQGFGICRPLAIEDLAVWLVGHRAQAALVTAEEPAVSEAKVVELHRRGA